MRSLGPRARAAFTLIELLVVIAIIGVLVAIILVAVLPILNKGPEIQTVNEIRQMSISVNNFKAKHGVYPPSRITLSGNPKNMDQASLSYVSAIWPRIDWNSTPPIDWAGTGTPSATYILEGDQCLVFFLGGIPDQVVPGCKGFSTNPKNPTDLTSGVKDGFYQFGTRLKQRVAGLPFYSYLDPWQAAPTPQPYAYFSSGKRKNGYTPVPPNISDCSLVPGGPYYEAGTNPIRYYNPTTFQIISAGKNGLFGNGGPWPLAAPSPPADDDQVNFFDTKLGDQ